VTPMNRRLFACLAPAALMLVGGAQAVSAASQPATWDDLVLTKSTSSRVVYLLPGADFRPYTKVMLDPPEIAFRKDWQRDYNRTVRSPSERITDRDVHQAVEDGGKAFSEILAKAFAEGGYAVVTTPGPDVLRLRSAVIDLTVSAPDRMTPGRSQTFAGETGSGKLVLEARDSMTGAVLGRAVDARVAGTDRMKLTTSIQTRSDFRILAQNWAKATVKGLNSLKTASPSGPGRRIPADVGRRKC